MRKKASTQQRQQQHHIEDENGDELTLQHHIMYERLSYRMY